MINSPLIITILFIVLCVLITVFVIFAERDLRKDFMEAYKNTFKWIDRLDNKIVDLTMRLETEIENKENEDAHKLDKEEGSGDATLS